MIRRQTQTQSVVAWRYSGRKQQGMALVMVMMVLALAVIIAASMTTRMQLQLQRQINLQERQQALWLAIGAENYIRRLLQKTAVGKDTVNLAQEWAVQGATFPVDGGATISGRVKDLQACFNLNSLQKSQPKAEPEGDKSPVDGGEPQSGGDPARDNGQGGAPVAEGGAPQPEAPQSNNTELSVLGGKLPAAQVFQRLAQLAAPELTIPPEYLSARLTDWLDADGNLLDAGGAEENDYAGLVFPFYNANSLMVSKSELRVILDMTAADYQQLAPFVCVLPQSYLQRLNVNTVTEEQAVLIAALVPELSIEQAKDVISSRPDKGFPSVEEFWGASAFAGRPIPDEVKSLVGVTSNYFQAEIQVDLPDRSFRLISTLRVDERQQIQVIARRFGGPG
jgi:general secretion pathway protein K